MSFFLSSPSVTQSSLIPSSSLPPTKEQLMQLRAVPSSMLALDSSNANRSFDRAKKRTDGGRDRVFNPQAGRPSAGIKNPSGQTIHVVDEFTGTFFSTSLSLPTYAGIAFTLSQFGNASEYLALFDQYKIVELEVWIEPNLPMATTFGSAPFTTCVDLDDATTPASAAVVLGKQVALTSETGTSHYHKWRPHMAVALYSGTFTSYGNVSSDWIDSASPGVQHFGIKAAMAAVDGVARTYSLTCRAHLAFRSAGI